MRIRCFLSALDQFRLEPINPSGVELGLDPAPYVLGHGKVGSLGPRRIVDRETCPMNSVTTSVAILGRCHLRAQAHQFRKLEIADEDRLGRLILAWLVLAWG